MSYSALLMLLLDMENWDHRLVLREEQLLALTLLAICIQKLLHSFLGTAGVSLLPSHS